MIIVQTPLRVSFAGGGTDLPSYYSEHEGMVVSTAIDKYTFVTVSERYDDKIYVNYSHKEVVDHVDEVKHDLVREAMRQTGIESGVEVSLLSDVPSEGSGLASSSSFTVGLLNAFHMFRGQQVHPLQLAREACEIEIERCGRPIGKQDQYIVAFGGMQCLRFRRDGDVEVERLPMTPGELRRFSSRFRLFFTGQTRQSGSLLTEQRARTEENLDTLARIKRLACEVRSAIEAHDYDAVGSVLHRNWELKKNLASAISTPHIDALYETALANGATGGKICGAGGGGFLLVHCPEPDQPRLVGALRGYRELPFSFEPDGSKVIFNYRRPSWK